MQYVDSFARLKEQIPNCQLTKLGCFYVVSTKIGSHQISSSPYKTIHEAIEEFEFKYGMVNFDNLPLAS